MHSVLRNFKIFGCLTWGSYIDKYTNNYSRVKPENIIKLKHYMHNGLSIYQTKYCKTTFLALPWLLILHTIQSSSSGQNSIITPEVATNPLLLQNCN